MSNFSISGDFFFRESTQEWVFEVTTSIPDSLFSISRYSGKTKVDALKEFQTLFSETLIDDLNLILTASDDSN